MSLNEHYNKMKKIIFILISILLLTSCGDAQSDRKLIDFTGKVENDINKFFSENSVVADIMDGIKQNPKQAELTAKFQAGIRENQEWFMVYIKTVPEGEPMPYHPNLGMTNDEYNEFHNLM